jgi:mannose-6-phosphate isomerase-like protein (cupin superfamily)
MRIIYFLISFFLFSVSQAQDVQTFPGILNIMTLEPDKEFTNSSIKKIYSDSSVTAFVLWVRQEVPLHKHEHHTEQVYVLEGTAKMQIGEVWSEITPGTWLVIPENTPHKVTVTSATPLKVLSIQTPEYDGSDRVLLK